jgi:hypothetical protein
MRRNHTIHRVAPTAAHADHLDPRAALRLIMVVNPERVIRGRRHGQFSSGVAENTSLHSAWS